MIFKTRKLISCALAAILASFFLTCIPVGFDGEDEYEDNSLPLFTDVEYSPDGKSVTIYLDGYAPVRQNRALTRELAVLGHDLFEVTFYHPASNVIKRYVWETGHAAGISGVTRNVNYSAATVGSIPAGTSNGAALLFVGKKSDRTLLGVGRLTGTDGGAGSLITANTKSVTFSVAALKAGVTFDEKTSSFNTAALQSGGGANLTQVSPTNTEVFPVMIGTHFFPIFRLNKDLVPNQTVEASYKFDIVGDDPFSVYSGGIIQKAKADLVNAPPEMLTGSGFHLTPRYPTGDGKWEDSTIAFGTIKDNTTGLSILNNLAGNNNNPFENEVKFRFSTIVPENNGYIFSFSFEIPVYPLLNGLDNRAGGFPWFLRPGYDSYLYDLDDGYGGTGGAILIGTGEIEAALELRLDITRKPQKLVYPYTSGGTDDRFDLYGIQVNLIAGNADTNYIFDGLLSIPPDDYTNKSVSFYLGGPSNDLKTKANPPITDPEGIPLSYNYPGPPPAIPGTGSSDIYDELSKTGNYAKYVVNGTVKIYVEYRDTNTQSPSDPPYYDFFTIFLAGGISVPDSDFIPDENRLVIASNLDVIELSHALAGGGAFIIVFYDNFNLDTITVSGASFYLVIIAGREGLTMGKSSGTSLHVYTSGTSNIFLGKWPLNDTLAVYGQAVTSYPFTINTEGEWDLTPHPGFLIDRHGSTVNIDRGPGLALIGNSLNN